MSDAVLMWQLGIAAAIIFPALAGKHRLSANITMLCCIETIFAVFTSWLLALQFLTIGASYVAARLIAANRGAAVKALLAVLAVLGAAEVVLVGWSATEFLLSKDRPGQTVSIPPNPAYQRLLENNSSLVAAPPANYYTGPSELPEHPETVVTAPKPTAPSTSGRVIVKCVDRVGKVLYADSCPGGKVVDTYVVRSQAER